MFIDILNTISSDSVSRIPESNSQSSELETLIPSSQADQLPSTPFVGKEWGSTFMDLNII